MLVQQPAASQAAVRVAEGNERRGAQSSAQRARAPGVRARSFGGADGGLVVSLWIVEHVVSTCGSSNSAAQEAREKGDALELSSLVVFQRRRLRDGD